MSLSSINITYSSQIKYDSQGVLLSTSAGQVFLSKSGISSITNNTSSLVITFLSNPVNFTITASANYLITNIHNNLTNQTTSSQQNDAFGDSDSEGSID